MRRCAPRFARTSRSFCSRSAGMPAASFRRRFPAARAIRNFLSRRGVAELLAIERLGHRGDGVAIGPDGPLYVSATLPGELVEAEPWPGHPDRFRLLSIAKPSPERIAPICPHFGICGGCAVQHWEMSHYRAWKRDLVVTALRQAGLDAPVGDLIDAHGAGRRRVVFHARRGGHEVLSVGFSAARAHRIVAIDRCPILAKEL